MLTLDRQLEAFLDEATNSLTQDDFTPEMEMDLRREIVLCEPLAAVMARQRLFAQTRRSRGRSNSLDVILHHPASQGNEGFTWDR